MKKLYRSKQDRFMAGVCGGIGDYLGVDSNVIRLVFVFIGMATGALPILFAYLVAYWMIPERAA